MSNFYTNAMVNGDQIFVRGVENGKKFIRKEDFFPTMYLKSKKESDWKTDRKSTRLNSSHIPLSRMPSSA